jgi:hypothetical protein
MGAFESFRRCPPVMRQTAEISAAPFRQLLESNQQLLTVKCAKPRKKLGPILARKSGMNRLRTYRQTLGVAALAMMVVACAARTSRVENVDYRPRPHLTISLVEPSTVLVHHSAGTILFDPLFGIGGEGIFPDVPYNGFSQSQDVFGDGSVVLVPMKEGGRFTTGMFVNLPSGRNLLFTDREAARQLRTKSNVRVFRLRDHSLHDSIAHFPDFES